MLLETMDDKSSLKFRKMNLADLISESSDIRSLTLETNVHCELGALIAEVYGVSVNGLAFLHENIQNMARDSDDAKYYRSESEGGLPIFGKTDRNGFLVKDFYKAYDMDYRFLQAYLEFINREIRPLFPDEKTLLIQKTPNIRFHVPGNTGIGTLDADPLGDIHGLHCDSEFGHPPFELNVVLPITKMYESNSIWYEDAFEKDIDEFQPIELNCNQFFVGYLNKLRHFNRVNKTGETRISLDFRIAPYSKFFNNKTTSCTTNNKFLPGDYYMMF